MVTPLEVMDQLTSDELVDSIVIGQQNPVVGLANLQFAASTEVRPDDPRTGMCFAIYVAAGVLTQPRADAIMAWIAEQYAMPPKPPAPTVTSSEAIPQGTEKDGRFWCAFIFTLSDGTVRSFPTLLDAGTDYDAMKNERAARLVADLAMGA